MCPKRTCLNKQHRVPFHRQQGFLIPLALFIVIVLGFLALALSRMGAQTHLASAQELVSAQAFYAAESGAQAGMNRLFFGAGNNIDAVNANCAGTVNIGVDFNGAPGLGGCAVSVNCTCTSCGAGAATSFYRIESTGTCGSGITSASRTIRVSAYMDRQ